MLGDDDDVTDDTRGQLKFSAGDSGMKPGLVLKTKTWRLEDLETKTWRLEDEDLETLGRNW